MQDVCVLLFTTRKGVRLMDSNQMILYITIVLLLMIIVRDKSK